jgi:arginyl-tRNA--protein-N-Asp/Glu arginylyltransferase
MFLLSPAGDYLYKQNNFISCCPHLTIRLNVHKYARNKAQRQAMNKLERFLAGKTVSQVQDGEQHEDKKSANGSAAMDTSDSASSSKQPADPEAERIQSTLLTTIQSLVTQKSLPGALTPVLYEQALRVYPYVEPGKKATKAEAEAAPSTVAPAAEPSRWHYSTNAALILAGAAKKLGSSTSAREIADLLAKQSGLDCAVAGPGFLNVLHLPGLQQQPSARPRANSATKAPKRQPFEKPGAAAAASSSAPAAAASPAKAHTWEVRQVPAVFHQEAFSVYKKYQKAVHKDTDDKLTPEQYTNFLCKSPLVQKEENSPYGGFHHHYLLDGKIVAVGVVDILPSCLSSVYLYYDPDFEHLNLGTVTAVLEIEWIQTKLAPKHPELKFYYLGYYIHTCSKMAYKGKYTPAELLCPVRGTWHSLAAVKPALDSLVEQQKAPATASTAARCVILSDVAPEVTEEDGSAPIYRAKDFVIHVKPSEVGAAAGAAKKRKKKKKKAKKAGDVDAPAAPAASTAADSGDEDEDGSAMTDVPPSAAASSCSSSSASAAPTSVASSAAASAASAATPAAASICSSSPWPTIDATHPYVFNAASKVAADAHRAALAQAVLPNVLVNLRSKTAPLKDYDAHIQKQIQKPILEYCSLVGPEVARCMVNRWR